MKITRRTVTQIAALGSLAVAVLSPCAAAQSVVYDEQWNNTVDGWGIVGGANMTLGGFSSSIGVTRGASYSLILDGPPAANQYGNGPAYQTQFGSSPSTALTTYLANATSVTLDVYVPPGNFGYYLQWDLALNNSVLGFNSVDSYNYTGVNIGGETTLTWTIPAATQSGLASNPTSTTSLNLLIGGGFTSPSDATYLDNLIITDTAVPEPGSMALFGMGVVVLSKFARRRKA